jgi:hypothetical protein
MRRVDEMFGEVLIKQKYRRKTKMIGNSPSQIQPSQDLQKFSVYPDLEKGNAPCRATGAEGQHNGKIRWQEATAA